MEALKAKYNKSPRWQPAAVGLPHPTHRQTDRRLMRNRGCATPAAVPTKTYTLSTRQAPALRSTPNVSSPKEWRPPTCAAQRTASSSSAQAGATLSAFIAVSYTHLRAHETLMNL
eukprot:1003067-Prymnesium_polylepis.1